MTEPSILSAEQYEDAFLAIEGRITPAQKAMLQAHYHAPGRAITAAALARAVGYESFHGANLQYGLLARRLRQALGRPAPRFELEVLVTFVAPRAQGNRHWLFVMRAEVAGALEALGWV